MKVQVFAALHFPVPDMNARSNAVPEASSL